MGYLDKLDLEKNSSPRRSTRSSWKSTSSDCLKLQRKVIEKGIAVCVAYEGEDAAGKEAISSD